MFLAVDAAKGLLGNATCHINPPRPLREPVSIPRSRTFRLLGLFQAKMPDGPFELEGEKRGAPYPSPEGRLGGMGIFFTHAMKGEDPAQRFFKWEVSSGPVSRTVSDAVEIDPSLEGTPFSLLGIKVAFNGKIDCPTVRRTAYYQTWHAVLGVDYWPGSSDCAAAVPSALLLVPADSADPCTQLKQGPVSAVVANRDAGLAGSIEYNLSDHFCSLARQVPSRHQVACVKGRSGVYILHLDATKNVFDDFSPRFKEMEGSFEILESR